MGFISFFVNTVVFEQTLAGQLDPNVDEEYFTAPLCCLEEEDDCMLQGVCLPLALTTHIFPLLSSRVSKL